MIKSIFIENYAIIKKVEVTFDESLNIITGETGAGKSIVLGALGLIMGQRADTSVLYDKNDKCVIEAIFTDYPNSVVNILKENEYDVDEELIIRREINSSGKSRAFVNDTPAKLELLSNLSSVLIDLNSQFEVTSIQQTKFQLQLIDALAGNKGLLSQYKEAYSEWQKISNELNSLQNKESNQLKEIEFIKFQYNELVQASLDANEQNELESEMKLLEKSEAIEVLVNETTFLISDSDISLKERLEDIFYKWQDFEGINDSIDQIIEKLNSINDSLSDVVKDTENVASQLEYDPSRLSEIKERLDLIYSLQRKHQVNSVEELLAIEAELGSRISGHEGKSERISYLQKEQQKLFSELIKQAKILSKQRISVFEDLEVQINEKLATLSMSSAKIKVQREELKSLSSQGIDDIQILFKANLGADFLPIKKVASGGESARLMLALKSTIADAMVLPTMIFDEIDTGVSGEIAGRMGDMIKDLSNNHQLICITHSPQVAARAIQHFFVYKTDTKERTVTHVKVLDKEERIIEIAKMLSGNPPTTFALENAKELIQS